MTMGKKFYARFDEFPEDVIQIYRESKGKYNEVNSAEFVKKSEAISNGLLALGVKKEDKIFVLADDRPEWMWFNIAIVSIYAVDVPRGTDSQLKEISLILKKIESRIVLVENIKQRDRILSLQDELKFLEIIIVMDKSLSREDVNKNCDSRLKILSLNEIIELGDNFKKEHPNEFRKILDSGEGSDLCTIIFTSGSTGEPKGVMITHDNFLYFESTFAKGIPMHKERYFCVLPIWHSFMRTLEYIGIAFTRSTLVYSKPIGRTLLEDLKEYKPTILLLVPRVMEGVLNSVYAKINKKGGFSKIMYDFFYWIGKVYKLNLATLRDQKVWIKKRSRFLDVLFASILTTFFYIPWFIGDALIFKKINSIFGGCVRAIIVGGAALPKYVEEFFLVIGIPVTEGYGLTEASPVISAGHCGLIDNKFEYPVLRTVGSPLHGTKVKIIDIESGAELGLGEVGELWIKGPQIMKGYYQNEEGTKKVIKDGWLNTGDLAMITFRHKQIKLIGRSKDTIVLMGGENLEPAPIEASINASAYIDKSIVVGQDRKYICAFILLNKEMIENYIQKNNLEGEYSKLIKSKEIVDMISLEIKSRVSVKKGFRPWEQIKDFLILEEPFKIGEELSAKGDLKRNFIYKKYEKEIDAFYKN